MKTHRPLLGIFLSLATGIFLNEYLEVSFGILLALTFLSLLVSLLTIRKMRLSTTCILIFLSLLGVVFSKSYQSLSRDHIAHIARFYRRDPVLVKGIVISDVKKQKFFKSAIKTTFALEIKYFRTKWGWRSKTGRILVNIFQDADITYGDYVLLEGKLHPPFRYSSDTKFSYEEYLRQKGIRLLLSVKKDGYTGPLESNRGNRFKVSSLRIKNKLKEILTQNLTANEAGIIAAIILGERSLVPEHIRELFIHTGTAHILAISGLHVGIVAFLVFLLLAILHLNRKGQYIFTILFLIFYAFLTGLRPSVVRATIMAIIFLSSFVVERETDNVNTLSLAAIVILLTNPLTLFNVGFQLSFASVLSIIYFYPRILKILSGCSLNLNYKPLLFLMQSLAISLAAWIGVVGIMAYYFHIITPVSIFANLLIIPLIVGVVALGMGLLIVGLALPFCNFIFAACIKVLLNLVVIIAYLFDQIPWAHFYINDISFWYAIGYYSIIITISQFPYIIKSLRFILAKIKFSR